MVNKAVSNKSKLLPCWFISLALFFGVGVLNFSGLSFRFRFMVDGFVLLLNYNIQWLDVASACVHTFASSSVYFRALGERLVEDAENREETTLSK